VGSSISKVELNAWRKYGEKAKMDSRLMDVHQQFLRRISTRADGTPKIDGYVPGINLVLECKKA
jgi:hypothetical protein